MILPTKYLPHDRALLSVGAEILAQLKEPRSVSELWECVREDRNKRIAASPLSFDWFVLALNRKRSANDTLARLGAVC